MAVARCFYFVFTLLSFTLPFWFYPQWNRLQRRLPSQWNRSHLHFLLHQTWEEQYTSSHTNVENNLTCNPNGSAAAQETYFCKAQLLYMVLFKICLFKILEMHLDVCIISVFQSFQCIVELYYNSQSIK